MKFAIEWRGKPVTYTPVGVWVQQGSTVFKGRLGHDGITKHGLAEPGYLEEAALLFSPYTGALGPIFNTNNYKTPDALVRAGLEHIRRHWRDQGDGFDWSVPLADLAG